MAEPDRYVEVTVGGHRLPALAVNDRGTAFVVPLENGWNAYVVAYPRPDEVEYAVAPITRSEARAVAAGEWGIGAEIGWHDRPDLSWPRGDADLLDSLESLSKWPSPTIQGVR